MKAKIVFHLWHAENMVCIVKRYEIQLAEAFEKKTRKALVSFRIRKF